MAPIDDVRAANRAYYEAFEGRDLDAMSALWEHSDRVVCTHPGWATLRGWGPVAASYFALFQNRQALQFILTEEQVEVVGDVAWVSLDENILGDQSGGGATVAALNLFHRDPAAATWRLTAHVGSVVSSESPGVEGPPR